MEKKRKLPGNKMLWDGILSIGAKCIFFLVLKGLIEPWMNRELGDAAFGTYVVYYGYICILAYSCGEALNHIRVLNQDTDRIRARDYRLIIAAEALLSILILFGFGVFFIRMDIGEGFLFGITSAVLMLRLVSWLFGRLSGISNDKTVVCDFFSWRNGGGVLCCSVGKTVSCIWRKRSQ